MNRETKIGLVTGVTLIVLIGAMLSSYLSAPHNGVGDLSLAGQGSQLRNQIINPVGIAQVPVPQSQLLAAAPAQPPMAQPQAPAPIPASGPAYTQPGAQYNQVTQLPYGLSYSGGKAVAAATPAMNPPVTPEPVVQTQTAPHVIAVIPAQAVAPANNRRAAANNRAAGAIVYTVRPGDTLGKIAWHFYHDSGPVAVRRIVSANRGQLGSARAMIRVGEALTIPAGVVQSTASHEQLLAMDAQSSSNAYSGNAYSQKATAPQTAKRIYRVQSGDTLFGIARKTMGAGTESNIHKIMVLNHIRDPRTIFVGQSLKIPG